MITVFFFQLLLLRSVYGACFDVNGKPAPNAEYQQCGNTGMCCATNRTSTNPGRDLCLPNGLCWNSDDEDSTGNPVAPAPNVPGMYWREGCSDPSWNPQNCLRNVCANAPGQDGAGNIRMIPCNGNNSTRWCCGLDTACCGRGDEFLIAATLGQPIPTSTSTSSLSTAIVTETAEPVASRTMSAGTSAAIGVGAAAACILIIGCIVYYWRMHRRKMDRVEEAPLLPPKVFEQHEHSPQQWYPSPPPFEAQTNQPRAELDSHTYSS